MTKIYVDADACPVKAEVEKTATRHKIPVLIVSNGGIRPSSNPIVTTVVVDHGADVADQWIADRCGTGDIVITSDIPLAARAIEHGSLVVKHNGEILNSKNIGPHFGRTGFDVRYPLSRSVFFRVDQKHFPNRIVHGF